MNNLKSYISIALLTITLGATAQAPRNSYFLENVPLRHSLNPALTPNTAYIALPAIGGTAIGANGNVGVDNFLFTRGGETVTGLNRQVSANDFLSPLKTRNYIEVNAAVNLLGIGFNAFGGFNTIGVTLRSTASADIPRTLFEFAKIGNADGKADYDISKLRIHSSNYIEIALGHSHTIGERLRIGAKIKYLAGIAYADALINQINITASKEQWTIRENGSMFLSNAIKATYKTNGEIDNIDTGSLAIQGNGFGVDLGAAFSPCDNLTVSAAATDIGIIQWNGENATLNPNEFIYDGFHHIGAEKDPTGKSALSQEADRIEDDIKQLVRFNNNQNASKTQSLATTLNIAAEYSLPNKKISFGLLSATRLGTKTWTEIMASANFRPARRFNAAVNASTSNLGHSFGAILNFCPRGFNLYIASDYIPLRYTKQGIPASTAKINLTLGIAITFGKNTTPKKQNCHPN